MNQIYYILTIFLGFGGFLTAFYISTKKRSHTGLVCPINSDCDKVVHSTFSKFFGIPLEYIGMSYYLLLTITYGAMVLTPSIRTGLFTFVVFFATFLAFLFSAYLVLLQGLVIKDWCFWCLTSASLSTIIFILSLLSTWDMIIPLFQQFRLIMLFLHIFGVSVGLGGAVIADTLFFKFLKDLKISHFESSILKTISQLIWSALALVTISGVGLFLADINGLLGSDKFIVKMIIMVVIFINGALLHFFIHPTLTQISFGKRHHHEQGELHWYRRRAFISGAVSISSWLSVFVLGMLPRTQPFNLLELLVAYLLVLLFAISGGLILEKTLGK